MKMFAAAILSVMAIPAFAQFDLVKSLQARQDKLKSDVPGKPGDSASVATPENVTKTKASGVCTEKEQSSLPLAAVLGLINQKNAQLQIDRNPTTVKLTVKSSEPMVGNCASMLEWVPSSKVIDGKNIYAVEVKFKKDESCVNNVCTYDVHKVENGQFKEIEKVSVAPTMDGFKECLVKAGVFDSKGAAVEGAIYPADISEEFDGYQAGGELLFLSRGPSSNLVKAKYDKFVYVDKCEFYEKITPQSQIFLTREEEEKIAFSQAEGKIAECKDYREIAEFIEMHDQYTLDLDSIRDKLILEAVKKSVKAINEGKGTEEDFNVLADFEKHIVRQKIKVASAIYNNAQNLEGNAKKAALEDMKVILAELTTYTKAPYITSALTIKLEAAARFDEAAKVNSILALIVTHNRLGAIENKETITPEVAMKRTLVYQENYAKELAVKKQVHETKTGQTSGTAQEKYSSAQAYEQKIMVRNLKYQRDVAEAQQDLQSCPKKVVSFLIQKCMANAQQQLQILQATAQDVARLNAKDQQAADKLKAEGQQWAQLEKEGAIYTARQNGEEVDPDSIPVVAPPATPNQGYNFNFQGMPAAAQTQQYPQFPQQQQPYSPYGQQQQYNPYGQQSQFSFYGQQQQNPYGYGQQQQYNPYGQQNFFGAQQYSPYGQQQQGFGGQFNLGLNLGGNAGAMPYGQQGGYNFGMPQQQNYLGGSYQPYSNYGFMGQ